MVSVTPIHRNLVNGLLAAALLVSTGCQTLTVGSGSGLPPIPAEGVGHDDLAPCDSVVGEFVPRELDKVTVPVYRVEPPDILTIDVVHSVSQATYALQVGDIVTLTVLGTFPDEPIAGEFQIGAGGVIELGYAYGSVEVAGHTVEEATRLLETHLQQQLRDPQITLSLRGVANMQQIAGEHLVAPDGTVTLGQYGSVSVVGLTLDEVRLAIAEHLKKHFANPQVSVSVFAYNSKAYYIVTQGGGLGDQLVRLPYTGNETVLDALSQVNGLSYVSSSRMWIARPNRDKSTSVQLPIDWEALTKRADVTTNYQLLPGDRLYIAHNRLVALDTAVARLTSPLERVLGFTLLGTGTASRLSGKVLDNRNNFGITGR